MVHQVKTLAIKPNEVGLNPEIYIIKKEPPISASCLLIFTEAPWHAPLPKID